MENGENLRLNSNGEKEEGFNHFLKEIDTGYQRFWLGAVMLAKYCQILERGISTAAQCRRLKMRKLKA